MPALMPAPVPAASNTATSLIPLDGAKLETHVLDCHSPIAVATSPSGRRGPAVDRPPETSGPGKAPTSARWTARVPRRARERAIRPGQRGRGNDKVTTVYLGEGPPEKYQTTGRIDATDLYTGQPKTDMNVIMCTHIQVVYGG